MNLYLCHNIIKMLVIEDILSAQIKNAVLYLYGTDCLSSQIQLQKTRKEFEGDITLVVFPLLKVSKKSPDITASEIGTYINEHCQEIIKFNVVKGFLNMVVSSRYYLDFLNEMGVKPGFGFSPVQENSPSIMVEYSSPNTNKPLHLGHIRNNLLGYAVSNILHASGKRVFKTNLVNDRGIHICKSMLAWQKWGNGETPETSGKKGDHLVGDYYVRFDKEYKKQISELVAGGMKPEEAEKKAALILDAQEMLRKWEAGDKEVHELWEMMNNWVYKGFNETYKRLGVSFDKIYYESETWVHGKKAVLDGLEKGVFVKHDDGSVWADLRDKGLDEKVLLRSDGTSVYMTQDIGTAQVRQQEYKPGRMVYVVGNEQNYHFKVLSIVLDMLGFPWAKSLYHLSYGMVELPEGKMKSREGTVVDADDLMDEMTGTAREMSKELGKLEGLNETEKEDIFRMIGLSALKYYMLKVDPVKNMLFDPRESIDFDGNTGPFIQYTYTRIRSVFRKASEMGLEIPVSCKPDLELNPKEKSLLRYIHDFPAIVVDAGDTFNPSLIANFIYDLVKEYNQFYHDYSILKEENRDTRDMRLVLSAVVADIVKRAMELLGIEMPERM
ncbi:MAG TPA: arginine--tRNA ligase [Bacteroidales bacterium]|nr:arginine--tRNA ligase [Bacteroidales bacterium]